MERSFITSFMVDKLHVEPRALELAGGGGSERFGNIWAPARAAMRWISKLPVGLLKYLGSCSRGHIVITHLPSRYLEQYTFRGRELSGVVLVCVTELGGGAPMRPLHVLGHLLDDLLGRGHNVEGPWLSEGGGALPPLKEVAGRIARLFPLGYGVDKIARQSPREYFAQSLALYFSDERRLNTSDPQMHRLFRRTLLAEEFWNYVERLEQEER